MKEMLAPFAGEGAGGGADENGIRSVQENLVTRDGEVEKELNKMRMLLVRVGDKVARLKDEEKEEDSLFREASGGSADGAVMESAEVEERKKVDALLERAFKRQKGDDGLPTDL